VIPVTRPPAATVKVPPAPTVTPRAEPPSTNSAPPLDRVVLLAVLPPDTVSKDSIGPKPDPVDEPTSVTFVVVPPFSTSMSPPFVTDTVVATPPSTVSVPLAPTLVTLAEPLADTISKAPNTPFPDEPCPRTVVFEVM